MSILAASWLIFTYRIRLASAYATASASTLWITDLLHTFPREVNMLLSGKTSITSVLFLINRYSFLGFILGQLISIVPGSMSNISCIRLGLVTIILQIISITTTNALFALRVYVIYGKSRLVLWTSVALIFPRIGLAVFQAMVEASHSTEQSLFRAYGQCVVSTKVADVRVLNNAQVAVPILVSAFDLFILVLTLRKTYRDALLMKSFGLGNMSLTVLLKRDGILYFSVALAIGLACTGSAIASLIPGISVANQNFETITGPFFAVLPNMLSSHLVLNLRMHLHDSPTQSQLVRESFLGNIGGSIQTNESGFPLKEMPSDTP